MKKAVFREEFHEGHRAPVNSSWRGERRNLYEKAYWTKEQGSVQSGPKGFAESNGHDPHMASPCKHPRVRVVSRQDDIEFVECVECGEVFDSDEFHDMEIEEKGLGPAEEEE